MIHITIQTHFRRIMLTEKSQDPKGTYLILSFIWHLCDKIIETNKRCTVFRGYWLREGLWTLEGMMEPFCILIFCYRCLVAQSRLALCDPMDCSTPGSSVLHHLPEFTQIHISWVSEATISPSNRSALHIRWAKYWNFSFGISPSNEFSGLISFRIDWLELAVQGTLKSLLQHHNSKASIFQPSAFFMVQVSHLYMTTGKTIALTIHTLVGKVMYLFFNVLSRCVIAFFPRNSSAQFSHSVVSLCSPMDCSMPGLPVHHQLPEFTQTHDHGVGDVIQPSHPLLSPSPPTFNLSQHQGLFQWVSSLHQVSKVLEFQLQHQSFQKIFRTDFL